MDPGSNMSDEERMPFVNGAILTHEERKQLFDEIRSKINKLEIDGIRSKVRMLEESYENPQNSNDYWTSVFSVFRRDAHLKKIHECLDNALAGRELRSFYVPRIPEYHSLFL